MVFDSIQVKYIEDVIKDCLRKAFQKYKPETPISPFHTRLLGKDRLALHSFLHSLLTNFGTNIFEPVAQALARNSFKEAKIRTTAGEYISEEALFLIQNIMDNLTTANTVPDKNKEIEAIRNVCQSGKIRKVKPTKVDIMLQNNDDEIYLIDLKSVKHNKGDFKEFKRTLLEWVGVILYSNPDARIHTLIAIPHNPYEPKPYSRWTIRGMLDLECELKVANEFWDFLGGEGTYQDLLDCFERVGIELRPEIDEYFAKFNK